MASGFSINSTYTDASFKNIFLDRFRSADNKSIVDDHGVEIIHEPFSCAVLPNFLDATNLADLETEVRKFPLNRRLNDLFSLYQSDDLLILNKDAQLAKRFPLLKNLRSFFLHEMRTWMADVTGAELDKDKVNSTISTYKQNDYLLCHDDELERRRIAFVIYLVEEDWDAVRDGGCLDLFESGPAPGIPCTSASPGDYHPWRVVRSFPPRRNSIAFFEVCSKSFHQVAEILGSKDRISVHGWFMSDPLPRVRRSGDPLRVPRLLPCFVELDLVYKWINPVYIDADQQKSILRRFRAASEIQLPQFFIAAQWEKLCRSLAAIADNVWLQEGPADLRNVSVLPYINNTEEEEDMILPEECRQIRRLLHSEAMLVILSEMTGIIFHPLLDPNRPQVEEDEAPGSKEAKRCRLDSGGGGGGVTSEPAELTASRFHRWASGMYTILADADSGVVARQDDLVWRLDLFYHCCGYGNPGHPASEQMKKDSWKPSWNGQIIYISRKDNEELLRVTPADNALTLVYCDSDSGRFVRYLNAKAKPIDVLSGCSKARKFAYDISLTYFDPSPNDGEVDDSMSQATLEESEDEEEEEEEEEEGDGGDDDEEEEEGDDDDDVEVN